MQSREKYKNKNIYIIIDKIISKLSKKKLKKKECKKL